MKRRGKRNTNSNDLSHNGSSVSVDSDSMTSEYYSSTSLSENTTKMSSTLSISREDDSICKKEVQQDSDSNMINNSSISLHVTEVDGNPIIENKEKLLVSNGDNNKGLLEAPEVKQSARREMSVPTETQTLHREEVRLRKVRKRFASETLDHKRHSADIESLLRLTASQGRNDGLGNVLNTHQFKMKLKRQSTLERHQDFSPSQTNDQLSVTRSANNTPPCVKGYDEIPPSPTDSFSDKSSQDGLTYHEYVNDQNIQPQSSEPKLTLETLPTIKRTYHNMDTKSDLVTSLKLQLPYDKAALFESEGSSSTGSMLYPLSSVPTSLDSSFSSDYTSLSNNLRVDDDNPSDIATPTSVTPVATREGTPSPELHQPLLVKEEQKFEDSTKKIRHTYNRSNLDFLKGIVRILNFLQTLIIVKWIN